MKEWKKGRIKAWMDEWKRMNDKRTQERMNLRLVSGWMNERAWEREWMNGWMKRMNDKKHRKEWI